MICYGYLDSDGFNYYVGESSNIDQFKHYNLLFEVRYKKVENEYTSIKCKDCNDENVVYGEWDFKLDSPIHKYEYSEFSDYVEISYDKTSNVKHVDYNVLRRYYKRDVQPITESEIKTQIDFDLHERCDTTVFVCINTIDKKVLLISNAPHLFSENKKEITYIIAQYSQRLADIYESFWNYEND